ncbi:uncharacterized protein METZ01_LOCUS95588, partial [marine metagenome]
MSSQLEMDLMGIRNYPPGISHLWEFWKFMRRYPAIPLAVIAILIFCGIFAPQLSPHDPRAGGIRDRHLPPAWTQQGTTDHLLGADHSGR